MPNSPIGQPPTIIDCQSRCCSAQPYHMKDQDDQDDQDDQGDQGAPYHMHSIRHSEQQQQPKRHE